jgi:hypothetical protein
MKIKTMLFCSSLNIPANKKGPNKSGPFLFFYTYFIKAYA